MKNEKYKALYQIPGKSCGCQDAKKGTILYLSQWIYAKRWTLNGKNLLTEKDVTNTIYFEKCQN